MDDQHKWEGVVEIGIGWLMARGCSYYHNVNAREFGCCGMFQFDWLRRGKLRLIMLNACFVQIFTRKGMK